LTRKRVTGSNPSARPGQPVRRMLVPVGQPDRDAREDTVQLLAAVGIEVTEDGKARARARLTEADARRTPERQAALRAQVGLPPADAA
jgi:uncharacterized membrane protein